MKQALVLKIHKAKYLSLVLGSLQELLEINNHLMHDWTVEDEIKFLKNYRKE